MGSKITKNFSFYNADQFKESFSEASPNNVYLFVGEVQSFANTTNPPTTQDFSQVVDYDIFNKIIAAKKVQSTDTSFVVPRYDWTANNVYAEYNNRQFMYNQQFFVYTEDRNVYKCLFNNKGVASTVKPTGTATGIIATSDGYRWRYMYTVSQSEENKFATTTHIPVKVITANDGSAQYTSQQAAVNGSIDVIDVTSGGSGWQYQTGTFASVTNSSVFQLSTAANTTADDIYNGSAVYVSSGTGAGLIGTVKNYTSATRTVTLETGYTTAPTASSTYVVSPKVTISGDGTNASAFANVNSSGAVNYVNVINRGLNYSYASIAISANSSHGSGANATPYLSPYGGHGSNPRRELGGSGVLVSVNMAGNESSTLPTNNEIRTFGLLADPLLNTLVSANGTNYEFTTRLTLTGKSGTFTEDEKVLGTTSSASANVVSFANTNATGTTGVLRVLNIRGEYSQGENITTPGGVSASISSITTPSVKFYTGEILYIENKIAITRDISQTEEFKFLIGF